MSENTTISSLFVTANVGSIFEDPDQMLKVWTEEFLATVAKLRPKFIALHCQEVGGKNYEKSMQHVEHFVRLLMSSEELRLFGRVRVYLDEDYSSAEHFTALGNFYFIHESLTEILIWDFVDEKFVIVDGKEIHSGNIEAVSTKEKAKFPQDFFPECKWSRKGFLRTRWSIEGTVFDLINIHLFHDASNFIAMEEFPSIYCKNRRRAFEHTLNRFHNDHYGTAPYFVFGDFNFRTDTDSVIKKLTEGLTTTRVQNTKNNDHTKLQYRDDDSHLILTVGKKEFTHSEHQNVFLMPEDNSWLRSLDRELEAFEKQLFEYPITFPPSYPFAESIKLPSSYMQTRCPSWCDRVLLSNTALSLISPEQQHLIEYNLMGINTCMGDHKPVYLRVELLRDSGTIHCCSHASALDCSLYPTKCVCCDAYASITINITDFSDDLYINSSLKSSSKFVDRFYVDKNLLHEPYTKEMLAHDPYTPESIESHSPLPTDAEKENIYNFMPESLKSAATNATLSSQPKKTPVSPRLLKSRLENILRLEKGQFRVTEPRGNVIEPSDRFTIKRCQSEDATRTENETFQRNRCMSESARKPNRVRLKSNTSANSCTRLGGHHSSSDEEWFEEVDSDNANGHKTMIPSDGGAHGNELRPGSYHDGSTNSSSPEQRSDAGAADQNEAAQHLLRPGDRTEAYKAFASTKRSSLLEPHTDPELTCDTKDNSDTRKLSCCQIL